MAVMDEKQMAERKRKMDPIRNALRDLRNRAMEAGETARTVSQRRYHEGREDAYAAAVEVLEEAIRAGNGDLLVGPGDES